MVSDKRDEERGGGLVRIGRKAFAFEDDSKKNYTVKK